jgi:translation initiation factor 4G
MMPGDNAPLEVSENRWTPTVQSRLSKDQPEDSPEVVERKVKALLNKLTIENFDSISKQILDWANKSAKEQDGRILKQVIALIFEKATDEATWSAVYARLCFYLNGALSNEVADQSIKEANGQAPSGGRLFRRYLLTRCQADYERGWAQKESATAAAKGKEADDKAKKDAIEKEAEAAGVDKEQAVKGVDFSEEYYAAEKAKRRGLGLVRFIGELYKLGMLKERM